MLSQVMSWLGIFLEAAVLIRGQRAKLVYRFPLFYSYLLVVLIQDIARYASWQWFPDSYANLYWVTQFVSLVMGSLVVYEICRASLQEFPGTAKMAHILLITAFAGVFSNAVLTVRADIPLWLAGAYVKLERDLRAVQGLALIILVVIFVWYAIPFARNLGAIFIGYSTFVALSVVQLSLVNYYWHRAEPFWKIVQPASYLGVLGFWLVMLWSADGVAQKNKPKRPDDQDYGAIADSTTGLLDQARDRLGSAVRT
jgi:hypothetical protein